MWYSEKGKNYGDSNMISGSWGLSGREQWTGETQKIFRALKQFCMML